ncbi:DUF4359 domain-containing protein [Sphingobacterium psychroaquaticum]|uniref:DUF4359 domain-containing protein n=1 Tax=Sphingobacterium psychroaquaticum TaxID=561061 RepID=A0A1X7L0P3_9SPHI|nr:DUF4359 domain-containing protein [Sphingobacterium psychroaquaticum]SMG47406.1 protein of unknown function [Sphingobacterium psychroaquaticum]
MSKTRIFALTLIALMLVAVFTNPTTEQMEAEVKAKATQLLKQKAGKKNDEVIDFGMKLFGNTLIDQFLENHIKVENYYLFSLTKIQWDNQEQVIGGGAFKQIWLSPKIDEKAKQIVAAIKGS